MSKQLDSIMKNIPPATIADEKYGQNSSPKEMDKTETYERIVAVIPRSLKLEIKAYIEKNPGETEKTVILRGLKQMGFSVDNKWIIDKRSCR